MSNSARFRGAMPPKEGICAEENLDVPGDEALSGATTNIRL